MGRCHLLFWPSWKPQEKAHNVLHLRAGGADPVYPEYPSYAPTAEQEVAFELVLGVGKPPSLRSVI